jgi:hypothetical protein
MVILVAFLVQLEIDGFIRACDIERGACACEFSSRAVSVGRVFAATCCKSRSRSDSVGRRSAARASARRTCR